MSDQTWGDSFKDGTLDGMRIYEEILVPLFTPFAHDLIERAAPLSGATALDVACGPGTVTRPLAVKIGKQGRVFASDISPAMIEVARATPVPEDAASVEWIEASVGDHALEPGSIDVLVCQQGLQFFPDLKATFEEAHKLLRPGGRGLYAFWAAAQKTPIFWGLREALMAVSQELADKYIAGPWGLGQDRALDAAHAIGFTDVKVEEVTLRSPTPPDVVATMTRSLFAAAIGPDMRAMSPEQMAALTERAEDAYADVVGRETTPMTTNLLTVTR